MCSNQDGLGWLRRPFHGMAAWPWFNKFSCLLDILHVVDYRGVASHLLGNAFWHFVSTRCFPDCRNQESSFDALNAAMVSNQRQHGVLHKLPRLDKANLFGKEASGTSFPVLRGPGVKAANTRAAVPFVAELSRQLDDGSVIAGKIRSCCEGLDGYLSVVYGGGIFLGNEELQDMERFVRQFNRAYMWLAHHFAQMGQCRFSVVPKHHYFCHVLVQARLINPRFTQTYKGESLVGRGCALFRANMSGPYQRRVQRKLLQQYILGFEISSQLSLTQLEPK